MFKSTRPFVDNAKQSVSVTAVGHSCIECVAQHEPIIQSRHPSSKWIGQVHLDANAFHVLGSSTVDLAVHQGALEGTLLYYCRFEQLTASKHNRAQHNAVVGQ